MRPDGRGAFHQWFGDSCYALAASYGGNKGIQHMLAVVYRSPSESAYGENPNWITMGGKNVKGNSYKEKSDINNKKVLVDRLNSAGFAKNVEIQSILTAAENGGRFFDLGVYDNTIPLKSWSSNTGRVVLLGDSAHAMYVILSRDSASL